MTNGKNLGISHAVFVVHPFFFNCTTLIKKIVLTNASPRCCTTIGGRRSFFGISILESACIDGNATLTNVIIVFECERFRNFAGGLGIVLFIFSPVAIIVTHVLACRLLESQLHVFHVPYF